MMHERPGAEPESQQFGTTHPAHEPPPRALYTADEYARACEALLVQMEQSIEHTIEQRGPEHIAVLDPAAAGRVTAAAVVSSIDLPPFDNSQMDGYAVCAADLASATADGPVTLPIGVTAAAGDPPVDHAPGTATPVMTGAAIPHGADAVVPIEEAVPPAFRRLVRARDVELGRAPEGEVSFTVPVQAGRFVRGRGTDLRRGAAVLAAGTRLTPPRIGALAAAGVATVPVRPLVRVLLCSTGDEIGAGSGPAGDGAGSGPAGGGAGAGAGSASQSVQAAENTGTVALAPGRIHDANTPMLSAALREAGAEVRVLRSDDDADSLRAALDQHWDWPDLIVTSGGISAGAFEVVRDALAPLGASFASVAMQPGGPQGHGLLARPDAPRIAAARPAAARPAAPRPDIARRVPALCFPGNPVSAMLSAELFLLPTLRRLAGRDPERVRAHETRLLAHDAESPETKLQLRRATIAEDGRVVLSGPSSHLLAGLAAADVIAEIPLGVGFAPENTPVTVWRIHD